MNITVIKRYETLALKGITSVVEVVKDVQSYYTDFKVVTTTNGEIKDEQVFSTRSESVIILAGVSVRPVEEVALEWALECYEACIKELPIIFSVVGDKSVGILQTEKGLVGRVYDETGKGLVYEQKWNFDCQNIKFFSNVSGLTFEKELINTALGFYEHNFKNLASITFAKKHFKSELFNEALDVALMDSYKKFGYVTVKVKTDGIIFETLSVVDMVLRTCNELVYVLSSTWSFESVENIQAWGFAKSSVQSRKYIRELTDFISDELENNTIQL